MAHRDIEDVRSANADDRDYEPPVVFDFGSVFEVTRGSSGGADDDNGQKGN